MAAVVGGGWREPGSIGGATARELARRGWRVAVVERDIAAGGATVGLIQRNGGHATLIAGDVSSVAGSDAIAAELSLHFGRLDALVNNIGIGSGGTVLDAEEADWDLVLDLNVKAAARMSKRAIPLMRGAGAIVNVSSVASVTPGEHATYTVSKAALEGLTRAIALYHGPEGIRANAIRVGEVATWRALAGREPADAAAIRDRRRARTVLGTEGDSWDVARVVAFLAGEDARWITGQIVTVDGGAGLKRSELWYSAADRVVTPMNSSID